MKTVAIICEYNPFHNGHKYHIEEIKKEFGENFVSLFITGACGDINNVNCYDLNRTREDSYVKPGIEIAKSAIYKVIRVTEDISLKLF